jgi:pilus assembly protein FimV
MIKRRYRLTSVQSVAPSPSSVLADAVAVYSRRLVRMLRDGGVATLLLLLSCLPASAWAEGLVGLGDIHLLSPINERLDAEIEVLGAAPDDLSSLQAQISSQATYARYGVYYLAYMDGVTAQIIRRTDGRLIVKLSSKDAIELSSVELLVELHWGETGRLVRAYTMVLHPRAIAPRQPAEAGAKLHADTQASRIADDSGATLVTREVIPRRVAAGHGGADSLTP